MTDHEDNAAAIYTYIEQKVNDWYCSEADEIFDLFRISTGRLKFGEVGPLL